jgi:hypothetical protein
MTELARALLGIDEFLAGCAIRLEAFRAGRGPDTGAPDLAEAQAQGLGTLGDDLRTGWAEARRERGAPEKPAWWDTDRNRKAIWLRDRGLAKAPWEDEPKAVEAPTTVPAEAERRVSSCATRNLIRPPL